MKPFSTRQLVTMHWIGVALDIGWVSAYCVFALNLITRSPLTASDVAGSLALLIIAGWWITVAHKRHCSWLARIARTAGTRAQ